MILSTKLLRPINQDAGVICSKCQAAALYYDAAEAGPTGYCGNHALLEDLDPDDSLNSRMLMGIPVSRTAAFPECMDIGELFASAPAVPRDKRATAQMWARLSPHNPPQGLDDVIARPLVVEWVKLNSIYSGDHKLDTNHYIEIVLREVDGRRVAFIFLKFQHILGSRFLAVVPEETVEAFFGDQP